MIQLEFTEEEQQHFHYERYRELANATGKNDLVSPQIRLLDYPISEGPIEKGARSRYRLARR